MIMTQISIPRELIVEALDNAGVDPEDGGLRESYSGRGMYGSACFGIVGSMSEFAAFLVELAYLEAENGADYARDLAQCVRSDNMGRSAIFYFPGATLRDDVEDDGSADVED
jgi:hypothetical protein